MSITYARFRDHKLARRASAVIRRRLRADGRVEVLRNDQNLSHHTIPLRMTASRVGAIAGGVAVGLLGVLTVATVLWAVSTEGVPIPAPGATLALSIVLAAVLGGLAGALSFASDNNAVCQRLQTWLRNGGDVVIVDSDRGHEQTLRMLGASEVGRLD